MSDLVLCEADGWYELEPEEILGLSTLLDPDDEQELFDAIDMPSLIERLDEREVIAEQALENYEEHDAWEVICSDVRILQTYSGLKGWIYRVWVRVTEQARAGT